MTIPAAAGYLALAYPLARAISFGRLDSATGVTLVAFSIAALSLAVVGQTAFMIATYASYARKDTRSPLTSMLVQASVCLAVATTSLLVHGPAVLLVLGLALSVSSATAGFHLTVRLWRNLSAHGTERLLPSVAKFVAASAAMAAPAWIVATAVPHLLGGSVGPRIGIVAAALVGFTVFLAIQAKWRSPELGWLAGGLGQLRGRKEQLVVEATDG